MTAYNFINRVSESKSINVLNKLNDFNCIHLKKILFIFNRYKSHKLRRIVKIVKCCLFIDDSRCTSFSGFVLLLLNWCAIIDS